MNKMTLEEAVAAHPYPDYADWWPLGDLFVDFMRKAIVPEWRDTLGNDGDTSSAARLFTEYMAAVYGRQARTQIIDDAVDGHTLSGVWSGEFDGLSYAFYRSAFAQMEQNADSLDQSLPQARRSFTQRVGRRFFDQVANELLLDLPGNLGTDEEFEMLRVAIQNVGDFLLKEQYLRDYFAFRFDIDVEYGGRTVRQSDDEASDLLRKHDIAHALYEMGYPVILPSAVYLFRTVGEAQHHSSRIIEELFRCVGYTARETDDFDPTGFPSDRVVEFWEIHRQ